MALYRLACADPAWTEDDVIDRLDLTRDQVRSAVAALAALGLFSPWEATPSGYLAVDPGAACARLLATQDEQFEGYRRHLTATSQALRHLVADFLGLESARREAVSIEVLNTREQLDATLNNLTLLVRRVTCALHSAPVPPPDSFHRSLTRIEALVARGVRSRSIYLERFAAIPYVAEYFKAADEIGAEIRLLPHLPLRMLIYDDTTAMLPIDPVDSFAGALLIRDPALVMSLSAFFEHCWIDATPLHATAAPTESTAFTCTPQQSAALRMMASGLKDEVIARRLGISPRTLSRLVAEVMERLEVGSRFEAGAKLAHLGWFQRPAVEQCPEVSGGAEAGAGTQQEPEVRA
ncbi:MAG: helix-turn-helix transcriptional regulator [Catenulispora sp.]|nr:helix-turn-helix transcriptional regulator [Catenulispora sp.]